MIILGINVGENANNEQAHDGGACLLIDGVISGAISEERLTREKYCGGYKKAVQYLLKQASITIDDVDIVAISSYGCEPDLSLFKDLNFPEKCQVVMVPSHHLSHACSAFYPSGNERSLILVADNEGNILGKRKYKEMWKNAMERISLYIGEGSSIELLERDMDDEDMVSLGELYGNMTHFIGLKSYQHAGKTMALASFGNPDRFSNVPLIELLDNGRLRCPMKNEYLNSSEEIRRFFAMYGHELPPERNPLTEPAEGIWADLAAATQHQLEEALLHKIRYWIKKTNCTSLCLAGGIALNCVANRRLLEETTLKSIYVQPNAGDQGQSLGNVLYAWHILLNKKEPVKIPGSGVYLGGEYTKEECLQALENYDDFLQYEISNNIIEDTAKLLLNGSIIGWFQGRSEWGPRALGNRSILADPRSLSTKDHINSAVKHREYFRPFAPVVPLEVANEYFYISQPCPYMTMVANVKENALNLIPAAIHIDGTARIQTVNKQDNPLLHKLLHSFGTYSGVPVLINTSFNNNEPIVETPSDAIKTFLSTQIDAIVLGDIIVKKREMEK